MWNCIKADAYAEKSLFITTSPIIYSSAEFSIPIESLLKEDWARVKNRVTVSVVS